MTRRFVPGQRIRQLPGGSLNAAIDAAGRLGELLPPGGPQQQFRGTDAPRLVVQVVNSTGGDPRERAVVGLGATVLAV
ncbi:MAG TPA: hypothetical protein PKC18_04080, partial [Lacipirellulaceae bacterium]|nr:hypothetical protein [Lacipirellulaceae bacterium]